MPPAARHAPRPWLHAALVALATAVAPAAAENASGDDLPPVASAAVGTPMTAQRLLESQPAEIRARLLQDKLVLMQEVRESGSLSGGLIVGLVIFDEPVDRVYAALSQTQRQDEYRSEVARIETVSSGGPVRVEEHHLKFLFQRYEYRLRYELDPAARQIRWDLEPGFDNDFDRVHGFWELYPLDDGTTLARFGTGIDIGPAVPAFLQDWITREKIPDVMVRTREWVESQEPDAP